MDEIEAVRTLGRDVPPPEPAAKRAARTAIVAHAEARSSRPRWLHDGLFGLSRPRIVGALAALGLVAVLASGQLPVGPRPDPAAAAALNHAADIAAAQQAASGDGYRYTKSTGAHLSGIGGGPERPNGVWALVPVSREIWIMPDGSGRLLERRGEPIWFGPADKAAWVGEGSPNLGAEPFSDTRFGPTPPGVDPGPRSPGPAASTTRTSTRCPPTSPLCAKSSARGPRRMVAAPPTWRCSRSWATCCERRSPRRRCARRSIGSLRVWAVSN